METKNLIKIKKGVTIQSTMIVMLISILMFSVLYKFVSENETQASITPDVKFNETYTTLKESEKQINSITTNIKSSAQGVTEVNVGDFGYYGLKGMLAIMLLPFTLVNVAGTMLGALVGLNNIIPPEIINAITTVVTLIIIFAALAFLTNRGKDST